MGSTSEGDQIRWRACMPTSDATTISLSCPLQPGQPWLVGRALDLLRQEAGVQAGPEGERYAVGGRRGAPLILGEPLRWNDLPLVAEALEPEGGDAGEFTLRLPPWSELAAGISEFQLWSVVDHLAAEFRAACGVISDGRAIGYPDLGQPEQTCQRLQRWHLGVLVPHSWLGYLRQGSTVYQELERSHLAVVLE
ncbi:MAG TPA: hypothetical protein VNH82_01385 [Candidatus Dormibacteraeota bacterium]|nr:hypothetical protein [Candidatus Dormibacteraeota bacterium]